MRTRAHGRGAIATIGLLLLLGGLIGAGVLWVLADREPNRAAEGFARAAPGCSVAFRVTEPGDYWVYEELSGVTEATAGCVPTTFAGVEFTYDLRQAGGRDVVTVPDTSMSYDLDAGAATSVARFTVDAPGAYEISALGSDPAVVAAVGGDPERGVERLRRTAIGAAIAGVVLGGLLLWASGRRSRRAAVFASPTDPGWGVTERDRMRRAEAAAWPPAMPDVRQVPINPLAPDERRVARLEPPTDAMGVPDLQVPGSEAVPVLPSDAMGVPDLPVPGSEAIPPLPPDATPPDADAPGGEER